MGATPSRMPRIRPGQRSSALACLALLAPLAAEAAAQNVLLIVGDDMGVDRVGVYGEHPDPGRTPVLDRLAARGVLFRNAWSNPVCSPTRATLLTGRYAFRTGIGAIISQTTTNPGLPLSEVTIPEMLGDRYACEVVGKWHLGSSSQGTTHALDSGFDHHAGSLYNHGDYYSWPKSVDGVVTTETTYATTDTTDEALQSISQMAEPWFLMVSYNAPHLPLHAPPDHLHTYDLSGDPDDTPGAHFRAAVEAMDTEIGRLLGAVDLSTTTVFFIGDNGTPVPATDAPFLPEHAKMSMYEGGLNVPFIVAGRGVTARGEECAALINTTDVFATVGELAGIRTQAEDSISIVPYLRRPGRTHLRDWVYAERFRPNGLGPKFQRERAIRDHRYKLIRRLDGDTDEDVDEFFDLVADPFELRNKIDGRLNRQERKALRNLRIRLETLSD